MVYLSRPTGHPVHCSAGSTAGPGWRSHTLCRRWHTNPSITCQMVGRGSANIHHHPGVPPAHHGNASLHLPADAGRYCLPLYPVPTGFKVSPASVASPTKVLMVSPPVTAAAPPPPPPPPMLIHARAHAVLYRARVADAITIGSSAVTATEHGNAKCVAQQSDV